LTKGSSLSAGRIHINAIFFWIYSYRHTPEHQCQFAMNYLVESKDLVQTMTE
jgi:hypothetical protein